MMGYFLFIQNSFNVAILKEVLEVFVFPGQHTGQDPIQIQAASIDPSNVAKSIKSEFVASSLKEINIDWNLQNGLRDADRNIGQNILDAIHGATQLDHSEWMLRVCEQNKLSIVSYSIFKMPPTVSTAQGTEIARDQGTPQVVTQVQKEFDSALSVSEFTQNIQIAQPFRSCWWQSFAFSCSEPRIKRATSQNSIINVITKPFKKPSENICNVYNGKIWTRRVWSVEFSSYK
jgi:hypothetical protein